MRNLSLLEQNLLCGSKTCAATLTVLCLLCLNYDASGQEPCENNDLKGRKIEIIKGYEKICAGNVPQLTVSEDKSGSVEPYRDLWQMRTNGNNGTWTDDWKPWTADTPVYDTTQIRRIVFDEYDCFACSDTVTIIVFPLPPAPVAAGYDEDLHTAGATTDKEIVRYVEAAGTTPKERPNQKEAGRARFFETASLRHIYNMYGIRIINLQRQQSS
jgi:hypothetical protein